MHHSSLVATHHGARRRLHSGWLAIVAALAIWPRPALAHVAPPVTPDRLWGSWNLDPLILGGIAAAAWLYGCGLHTLWQRAGVGRGVPRWRAACFYAGLGTLVVALVSPLDRLGVTLFSAHMVQHLLLILAAAPLLVLGEPLAPLAWSLPRRWRLAIARGQPFRRVSALALAAPLLIWSLHVVALWLWHLPALYNGALESEVIHAAEHASFFGTALLFWWVLSRAGPRRRLGYGAAVMAVFIMGAQGGVLGALIALAREPWYPLHAPNAAGWGLTPLEDQQLAGFIMWMPAGAVYLIAGLLFFTAWLRTSGRRRVVRAEATAA